MPTLGVFAAIFDDERRILCVRANYGERNWTTPGGRVEAGESPLDALRREVMEEVGLEVELGELLGVYAKLQEDDVVLSVRARVIGGGEFVPNAEIAECGYFGRDQLPDPMTLAARSRILDALDVNCGVVRVISGPVMSSNTSLERTRGR